MRDSLTAKEEEDDANGGDDDDDYDVDDGEDDGDDDDGDDDDDADDDEHDDCCPETAVLHLSPTSELQYCRKDARTRHPARRTLFRMHSWLTLPIVSIVVPVYSQVPIR